MLIGGTEINYRTKNGKTRELQRDVFVFLAF
jgi:hypothetical protein